MGEWVGVGDVDVFWFVFLWPQDNQRGWRQLGKLYVGELGRALGGRDGESFRWGRWGEL